MTSSQSETGNYRTWSNSSLNNAGRLALVEDKPVLFDYWTASLDSSVIIGIKENGDKLLVKSEDEYTSPILKIYKVEKEYIIMTENSIYLVDNSISTKRISN